MLQNLAHSTTRVHVPVVMLLSLGRMPGAAPEGPVGHPTSCLPSRCIWVPLPALAKPRLAEEMGGGW